MLKAKVPKPNRASGLPRVFGRFFFLNNKYPRSAPGDSDSEAPQVTYIYSHI